MALVKSIGSAISMTYFFQWAVFTKELLDQDIFCIQLQAQEHSERKFQELEPAEEEPAPEPSVNLNELD